ncbi:hypothetical protein CKALI_11020 [Corynebacterium kalinowskii]|uniref:Glycosyltransferase RgtA/B/C/D-like domain-containing protein n=1 Tax=Corynebacterium kalinowskii TaxID=2675216 RepID=A0A6B8VFZ9_9CORY|nr:hypothetical protein [Corynebacterium kalinowskii]QGU03053.1 hypothetical protein CKALI_11020 [Corynebacterium kalinowskii]
MESVTSRRLTKELWFFAVAIFAGVSALRLYIVSWLADAKGHTLEKVLTRWDAVHYMGIANGGYFENMDPNALDGFHSRLAFFPLFPFLLRILHETTGLEYFWAGFLINCIAGALMVAAVMAVVKHMGWGKWVQAVAGVAVAGAPMALTYNMVYTEALFGALSLWALWAMLERRWFLAGALVFFTGLTRLTAVDLWVVFLVVVVAWGLRSWKAWAALVLSPLGMVAYIMFVNSHTADVGGYFGIQKKGWGSAFDLGRSTWEYLTWIFNRNSDSWIVLVGLSIVLAVVLVVFSFGKMPWPVWLFGFGVAMNVILSDGTFTARPRLLLPVTICLLPLAMAYARSFDRIRGVVGMAVWVVVGAVISVHPLISTGWAI